MRAPQPFALVLAFSCLLAACGQTGPLYLPPTCSPVQADGTVVDTFDEDGELLPPCPPPEPDEAWDMGEDDMTVDEDDEFNQDFQ